MRALKLLFVLTLGLVICLPGTGVGKFGWPFCRGSGIF